MLHRVARKKTLVAPGMGRLCLSFGAIWRQFRVGAVSGGGLEKGGDGAWLTKDGWGRGQAAYNMAGLERHSHGSVGLRCWFMAREEVDEAMPAQMQHFASLPGRADTATHGGIPKPRDAASEYR